MHIKCPRGHAYMFVFGCVWLHNESSSVSQSVDLIISNLKIFVNCIVFIQPIL